MEAHRGERGVAEVAYCEKRGKAAASRMRAAPRLEKDAVPGQAGPAAAAAANPGFPQLVAHQPALPVASLKAQGHREEAHGSTRGASQSESSASLHCPLSILSAYAVMASQETPDSVHIHPLASDATDKGHGPHQSMRSPPSASSRLGSQLVEQSGTHGRAQPTGYLPAIMRASFVSTYRALTDPFPQTRNAPHPCPSNRPIHVPFRQV
jgi:hypothetical protein